LSSVLDSIFFPDPCYGGLEVRLANVPVNSVKNPSILYNTDDNLKNDTDIIADSANLLSPQGKCLLIDTPDKEDRAEIYRTVF